MTQKQVIKPQPKKPPMNKIGNQMNKVQTKSYSSDKQVFSSEVAGRKKSSTQARDNQTVKHLKRVLADTFVLYMKTYVVHWNYTGENFFSVHKLTEVQYGELAEAIDEIAERIRAIGTEAPISLSDVLKTADLKEMSDDSDPVAALRELAEGHALLSKCAKEAADATAEANDDFSNDMMIGRIGAHDKATWMLNSFVSR